MTLIRSGITFVGREAELARLSQLAAAAGEGSAAAVLVSGDAGVGKTRLTAEVLQRAGRGGAVTAVGRCVDLGTGGLPYLPFTEVFAALAAEPATGETMRSLAADRPTLARLAGRAGRPEGVDDAQQRLALFEAVAAGLRAISSVTPGPLLLLLEDLHWADAATRDLLRFLLSRLSDERLLLIGTYRADDLYRRHPLRGLLAELVRLPAVERLDLAPFDDVELRDYLRELQGGEVAEWLVQDIGRRSEGNAFYAAELLTALEGCRDGAPEARHRPRHLPDALADLLLARLERLPESAQRIAQVAAVGGRRVADQVLRAAAALVADPDADPGRPGPEPEDALREAVAHRILLPDGSGRFAFRHALLQEAVYADLLPGERARIHGIYARLLAAEPSPAAAADLALHSTKAGDPAGALAAWLVAAREAERRLAPAEALAHYEQVEQLWPVVPPERRPDGATLVEIELAASATAAAAAEVRRGVAFAEAAVAAAVATGDPRLEAHARHRLAAAHFFAEQIDPAMIQIRAVYRLTAEQRPSPERVWAATVEARIMVSAGDVWEVRRDQLIRGAEIVEEALADARALGMAAAEADLLISLAVTDGIASGVQAADRRLEEALRCGRRAGDPDVILRASFVRAVTYLDVGDLERAEQVFAEALAEADRAGTASSLFGIESRSLLAQVRVVRGEWDAAARTVGDAERPRLPAREALFLGVPLLPAIAAQDPPAALARVQALVDCDPRYPVYWHVVLVPKAEALLWQGDPEGAVEAVEEALASFRALGSPLLMGGLITAAVGIAALVDVAAAATATRRPDAVEAARARGRQLLDHARRVAVHGPTRLRSLGPEGGGWLLRAEAEATRLAGEGNGAGDVDAWRDALGGFAYGHVYESARCGWRLAEALLARGAAGDREEAATLAREARRTASRLGARPLRQALDGLALRHRLDIGGGRAAATVLTPRETEVVGLVADGLTNREIGRRLLISEKTASVHVSNLMAKLGASSRAEAVSVAHRRGLLGPAAASTVEG